MHFFKILILALLSLTTFADIILIQTIDGSFVEVERNEVFRSANKDLLKSKSSFECKPHVMELDFLDSNLIFVNREPYSKVKLEVLFKFSLMENCEEVKSILNKSKCGLTASCDLLFCSSQNYGYSKAPATLHQLISTLEDGYEISAVDTFGSMEKCKRFIP